MLKSMKTYLNKIQDGDIVAQLKGIGVLLVVVGAVILYMHSHGMIWFSKY